MPSTVLDDFSFEVRSSFNLRMRHSGDKYVNFSGNNSFNVDRVFSKLTTGSPNSSSFVALHGMELKFGKTAATNSIREIDLKAMPRLFDAQTEAGTFSKIRLLYIFADSSARLSVEKADTEGFTGWNLNTNVYLVTRSMPLLLIDEEYTITNTTNKIKITRLNTDSSDPENAYALILVGGDLS